jgi:hypothetical protein
MMKYEDEAILYKYCCQHIDLDGHRSWKNGGKLPAWAKLGGSDYILCLNEYIMLIINNLVCDCLLREGNIVTGRLGNQSSWTNGGDQTTQVELFKGYWSASIYT